MLWSKLEIVIMDGYIYSHESSIACSFYLDPATMGDQGVYACVANNQHGVMAKNFKAEYTY
ncbi:hypothetical protein ANCCAN_28803 [Ancylostoma caninum]|uniref:Immunoglobulin I-set domain-containing protein n=1 Tax=Ancylostoma caninum TaxID=29170 RepID=A0A368F084_ANCCA|nr:hypothetical protein ANCCAN_28803 [Ancylostoma caninum]